LKAWKAEQHGHLIWSNLRRGLKPCSTKENTPDDLNSSNAGSSGWLFGKSEGKAVATDRFPVF
jgi:hypothetical protein